MLVNNAGLSAIKPLLYTDVDAMDPLIELNITALTRLSYAVPPAFVSRGTDTIINIIGLDLGEVIIIPVLQDGEVWNSDEAARLAMSSQLSG